MNSTDQKPERTRKERLDEILKMIGGLEVSILDASKQRDWDFAKELKKLKPKYYEQLRRVTYGLRERPDQGPTEDS